VLHPGSVIILNGLLGTGKTTFVKGMAIGLGVSDCITSPSFTLINEYHGDVPFFHIDVYRLDSPEEFEFIGGEDYLYSEGITVIEWGEKIKQILPPGTIQVKIHIHTDGSRIIQIEGADL